MDSFSITPIGCIHTPFKQKLGIPRQPGLSQSAQGLIELTTEFRREDCLRELQSFSHLWITFLFSEAKNWKPTISPPRLEGKKKVGVFASRSPHRPNNLGLSVVKLLEVTDDFLIRVSGVDMLDQTPIIDIKPYLPQWDSISDATQGWTTLDQKKELQVIFELDQKSEEILQKNPNLGAILKESLASDLRPTTQLNSKIFKQKIMDFDVEWNVIDQTLFIRTISHSQGR